MEKMIFPDKKLLTKMFLILSTVSISAIMLAVLLQLLLPLKQDIYPEDVAIILWPIILLLLLVIWLVCYPILVLWVKNLQYFLGEERITIHKGVLTKTQQNIPYRAITDFILHRSLYDRWLGIASLRVQTAGQSSTQATLGYEGNLAGLLEWEDILGELREKLRAYHRTSPAPLTGETASKSGREEILERILQELKAIRKALEKS